MLTNYNLKMPHAVYGGENAMENIAGIIHSLGVRKVAMFTDKGLRNLGLFSMAENEVKSTMCWIICRQNLPIWRFRRL